MHYQRAKYRGEIRTKPRSQPRPKNQRPCGVEDCGVVQKTRGLCQSHYLRLLRHGDPNKGRDAFTWKGHICMEEGCTLPVLAKGYCREHYDKRREYKQSVEWAFHNVKYSAKRKGHTWDLTLEQFKQIKGNPCFYCEGPLPRFGGLDRIDNSLGYSAGNILPCCTKCNMTRGDRWSPQEMKVMIKALLDFRRKQSEQAS